MPIEKQQQEQLFGILQKIKNTPLSQYHVVLLPDFFVDHFLHLDEYPQAVEQIQAIYSQGGGNLPGITQRISSGGNAANTAHALASLGVSTHLICRTDKLGQHLLEFFLGSRGVDLSGVKTDGALAITTALEFGKHHVNVMIGDPGSVSDFSFDQLDTSDLQRIAQSDMVCVMNWNLNNKGTTLAQQILRYAKENQVKTFFDSGDPSVKKQEIDTLYKTVLSSKDLDILGLNENELKHFSGCFSCKTNEEFVNAATRLKQTLHARVDLHTAQFACTITDTCIVVPSLQCSQIRQTTGAGDTWNAGNIIGELTGCTTEERLLFSNLIAGWYVSSPNPVHPTLEDLGSFLSKAF